MKSEILNSPDTLWVPLVVVASTAWSSASESTVLDQPDQARSQPEQNFLNADKLYSFRWQGHGIPVLKKKMFPPRVFNEKSLYSSNPSATVRMWYKVRF